jgi:hypothetical protein
MSGADLRYWRERLEDVCPFYKKSMLMTPHGVIYNGVDKPSWPDAVNTVTLYEDFLYFWHDNYVLSIQGPKPKPPHVRAFYATLKDFLFINGDRPRQRKVSVPRQYQGTIFLERKYQRFIYLRSWAEHVNTFEKLTKSSIKCHRTVAVAEQLA